MSSSVVADAMVGATNATIAQADEFRKSAAINALVKVYGPTAYDPQAALQMSQSENQKASANRTNTLTPLEADQMGIANQHSRVMNPLLEQNQGIANQQGQENLDYSKQNHPLLLQNQQGANVVQQQQIAHATAMNPSTEEVARQQATQEGQKTEAGASELSDMQARRTQGGMMAMQSLLPHIQDALKSGQDPNAVFDAAVAQVAGITKTDPKHYEAYRQQFLADPNGALDKIKEEINSAQLYSMKPVDRAKVAESMVNIENKKADTQNKQQELVKKSRENVQAVAGQQLAADSSDQMFETTQRNLGHLLELNSKAGRSAAIAKTFPGIAAFVVPEANDFNATLQSVHSDIVNNVINRYKESGDGKSTGLGRLMATEINLWTHAYAAVDSAQSPAERAKQIKVLQSATETLKAKSDKYFESIGVKKAGPAEQKPVTADSLSDSDKQAAEWAAANPNDPDAIKIKQVLRRKLGID